MAGGAGALPERARRATSPKAPKGEGQLQRAARVGRPQLQERRAADRVEGEAVHRRVGEHVERVGEEAGRLGQPAGDELDREHRGVEGQQEAERARFHLGRVVLLAHRRPVRACGRPAP